MSATERRVWQELRGRQLAGNKFRRQLPVGPYFVDFVCLNARLVVKIDGAGHEDEVRDRRKTDFLESQGFRVLRIPVSAVDEDIGGVIDSICYELEVLHSPPQPSPASGEGA